jgi:SNF2 family DNA or RNA helicase
MNDVFNVLIQATKYKEKEKEKKSEEKCVQGINVLHRVKCCVSLVMTEKEEIFNVNLVPNDVLSLSRFDEEEEERKKATLLYTKEICPPPPLIHIHKSTNKRSRDTYEDQQCNRSSILRKILKVKDPRKERFQGSSSTCAKFLRIDENYISHEKGKNKSSKLMVVNENEKENEKENVDEEVEEVLNLFQEVEVKPLYERLNDGNIKEEKIKGKSNTLLDALLQEGPSDFDFHFHFNDVVEGGEDDLIRRPKINVLLKKTNKSIVVEGKTIYGVTAYDPGKKLMDEYDEEPYTKIKILKGFSLNVLQIKAVSWLRWREENEYMGIVGGALALDMGLGKTFTLLVHSIWDSQRYSQQYNKKCPPTLIVCPKTVIDVWLGEFHKFFGDQFKILILRRDTLPRPYFDSMTAADLETFDFVITNYETLVQGAKQCEEKQKESNSNTEIKEKESSRIKQKESNSNTGIKEKEKPCVEGVKKTRQNKKMKPRMIKVDGVEIKNKNTVLEEVFKVHWRRVGCDESHLINNMKSQKWNGVHSLKRSFTVLLSGTPVVNYDSDVLSALLLLGYQGCKSIKSWSEGVYKQHRLGQVILSITTKDAIHEGLISLPSKISRYIPVPLHGLVRCYYNFVGSLAQRSYKAEKLRETLCLITTMRQICNATFTLTPLGKVKDVERKSSAGEDVDDEDDMMGENDKNKDEEWNDTNLDKQRKDCTDEEWLELQSFNPDEAAKGKCSILMLPIHRSCTRSELVNYFNDFPFLDDNNSGDSSSPSPSPSPSPSNPSNPSNPSPTILIPSNPSPTILIPSNPSPTILIPSNPSPTILIPSSLSPSILIPSNPSPTILIPSNPSPTILIPSNPSPTILIPSSLSPSILIPSSLIPSSSNVEKQIKTKGMDTIKSLERWIVDERGTSGFQSPKIIKIIEILRNLKKGDKILIFSSFTKFLFLLQRALLATGKYKSEHIAFLYGKLSTKERKAEIQRFKEDPNCCIFCLNYKTAATGLTLTVANYSLNVETFWHNVEQRQAFCRIYRIGQMRPTTELFLLTENTIENNMLKLCTEKEETGSRYIEKAVSMKDLSNFF